MNGLTLTVINYDIAEPLALAQRFICKHYRKYKLPYT